MKGCSNRVRLVVGAMLLMVTLAACAGAQKAPAQKAPQQAGPATFEGQPASGFVEMKEVQVAYMGNAGGGDGTLTFQGQRYPFKIAGLGVGGIGVSMVDAEGEVYRLTDLQQFPGFYRLRNTAPWPARRASGTSGWRTRTTSSSTSRRSARG